MDIHKCCATGNFQKLQLLISEGLKIGLLRVGKLKNNNPY